MSQQGDILGGRYTLTTRIASGGMGDVWEAHDEVLGREVAVKVMRVRTEDEPVFAERFRDEARNTAGLQHPNIATVYDYGEENGTAYLVMELVQGEPLSAIIARGPVSEADTRRIVGQAALALAAAHTAGVIHRDVKPANILITPEGQVKLTDFGIARATDSAGHTRTGEVIGTPHYLSPEQALGRGATEASDVYALGIVAHEMLTGLRPFDGGSPVATAMAQVRDPAPPLPSSVSPGLRRIVMSCLEKDPADRPASAAHLASALGLPVAGLPNEPTAPMRGLDDGAAGAGFGAGLGAGAATTQVVRPDAATSTGYAGAAGLGAAGVGAAGAMGAGAQTAPDDGSGRTQRVPVGAGTPGENPYGTGRSGVSAYPVGYDDGYPSASSREDELAEDRRRRRRALWWWIPIVVAVAALAFLAWNIFGNAGGKPAPAPTTSSSSAPTTSSTTSTSTTTSSTTSTTSTTSTPPTTTPAKVTIDPKNYVGSNKTWAEGQLTAAGLNVIEKQVANAAPDGQVIDITPTGSVNPGATITLTVSTGPGTTSTPPAPTTSAAPTASGSATKTNANGPVGGNNGNGNGNSSGAVNGNGAGNGLGGGNG